MKINLKEIVRNPWVVPILVGAANFTVGYYVSKARYYKQLSDLLNSGALRWVGAEESAQLIFDFSPNPATVLSTADVQERLQEVSGEPVDYRKFFKDHPSAGEDGMEEMDPRRAARLLRLVGEEPVEVSEEDDGTRNIFAENSEFPGWNQEQEEAARTEAPYVLHRDEYFAQEHGWTQMTLTYYGGDEILVDERDTPIDNHRKLVGALLFGHGSGDPNVVYIRNSVLKTEFEIMFDPGHYMVEVLGQQMGEALAREDELKHEHRSPRFRPDD